MWSRFSVPQGHEFEIPVRSSHEQPVDVNSTCVYVFMALKHTNIPAKSSAKSQWKWSLSQLLTPIYCHCLKLTPGKWHARLSDFWSHIFIFVVDKTDIAAPVSEGKLKNEIIQTYTPVSVQLGPAYIYKKKRKPDSNQFTLETILLRLSTVFGLQPFGSGAYSPLDTFILSANFKTHICDILVDCKETGQTAQSDL